MHTNSHRAVLSGALEAEDKVGKYSKMHQKAVDGAHEGGGGGDKNRGAGSVPPFSIPDRRRVLALVTVIAHASPPFRCLTPLYPYGIAYCRVYGTPQTRNIDPAPFLHT
jgi:hypothetical protein